MEMITVQQADEIIDSQVQDFGTEEIDFQNALGRVLAENIRADRDLPPFNRPTVDGIAINFSAFEKGIRSFKINAIKSAREPSLPIFSEDECMKS